MVGIEAKEQAEEMGDEDIDFKRTTLSKCFGGKMERRDRGQKPERNKY